jgi:hypothetical protein
MTSLPGCVVIWNSSLLLFFSLFTPTLQKSRMPQILGVEGEAVILYREPSTTQVEDSESAGRCGIFGFPGG